MQAKKTGFTQTRSVRQPYAINAVDHRKNSAHYYVAMQYFS
jgi:hypothetical protein